MDFTPASPEGETSGEVTSKVEGKARGRKLSFLLSGSNVPWTSLNSASQPAPNCLQAVDLIRDHHIPSSGDRRSEAIMCGLTTQGSSCGMSLVGEH